MIIGVPRERSSGETRVALTPAVAARLGKREWNVVVESGAGEGAHWPDERYREAGCAVVPDRETVLDQADVVLVVHGLGAADAADVDAYRAGQVLVGLLGPYALPETDLSALAERGVSAFAVELVPRIGRAQAVDVLTSMASLGGYKAAVLAAEVLPKLFPMQMTAAGTVRPAETFVVGAGVAGLQAIATARRLGARVRAYDVRPPVREEVESLGATFVDLGVEPAGTAGEGGYARAQDEAFYRRQREAMADVVADVDVVITTAAVPGRPAPELVSASMIEGMAPGSVVVDLAAGSGGNCEPTRPDERVEHAGVTILGPTNLPATLPVTASQLYATNLANFVELLAPDGELAIDTGDEIVDATLLVHDGAVRWRPAAAGGPGGTA